MSVESFAADAPTLAVVGGGWAGLAAAVEATRLGHRTTLFEMAPRLGGRARSLAPPDDALDNGQHILIGAYVETLGLLTSLGVDAAHVFERLPLTLVGPDGAGLRLPKGPPALAFARAVLGRREWSVAERAGLLATALGWRATGFRAAPETTVAALAAGLSARVRRELIEPLCVAALNTAAAEASAEVFLRVLCDALFTGRGSADLLLPRVGLDGLLPGPAERHLLAAGATIRRPARVAAVEATGDGWQVDGVRFDRVVLAAGPVESARLARPFAPAWAAASDALAHEPIATVYLQVDGARLPTPMVTLFPADRDAAEPSDPAQFVVDRGWLGGPPGLLAFVVSGASSWVAAGIATLERATLRQARTALALPADAADPVVVRTVVEKRATFRCTPALRRPPMRLAEGCHAAGDQLDGPYPATLEGAVRSGLAAVRGFG